MTEPELVNKIREAYPSPYKIGEAYPLTITSDNGHLFWPIAARIDQSARNGKMAVIHFYYPRQEDSLSYYRINQKGELSYQYEIEGCTAADHCTWHKEAKATAAKAAKKEAHTRASKPARKRLEF